MFGIYIQSSEIQRQKENLEIIWGREGMLVYRGKRIRIMADFSSVDMRARIEQTEIVNVLKKKT